MIQFDGRISFQMGWFNHPTSYMIPTIYTIYTVKAFSGDVWGFKHLPCGTRIFSTQTFFLPQVEAVLTKAVADSAWILSSYEGSTPRKASQTI